MTENNFYYIVIRNEEGSYSWTFLGSEEDFEKSDYKNNPKVASRVVAHGIPEEEAIRKVREHNRRIAPRMLTQMRIEKRSLQTIRNLLSSIKEAISEN